MMKEGSLTTLRHSILHNSEAVRKLALADSDSQPVCSSASCRLHRRSTKPNDMGHAMQMIIREDDV